jgi:hypothetical protein
VTTSGRLSRWLALSMAVAAMVTLVEDIWVSHDQGSSAISGLSILVVVVAIAAGVGAAVGSRRLRLVAMVPATVVAAGFGAVAFTSVGLPMLVAAALGVGALYEDRQLAGTRRARH